MCDYCKIDEYDDAASDAIFEGEGMMFDSPADFQLKIYNDDLELWVGVNGTQLIGRKAKIKFCPFCGRKLNEELPGYDDHDVSGLLEN